MVLSAVAIFLPQWLTAPTQRVASAWLAPGGRMTILAARAVSGSRAQPIADDGALNEDQTHRMLTSLSLKLQELYAENRSLLGIRNAVGPSPVLIPARVVGYDSLGLPSVEIDRGTDAGVQAGLPVLATLPLDLLQNSQLDPKLTLAAGIIVGTVDFGLGPYASRVKLINASDTHMFAQVIRFVDGKTQVVAPRILLEGVPKKDFLVAKMVKGDRGVTAGDFIVPIDPEKLGLPVPMVLGIVDKVDVRTDSRMLVDLTIKPLFEKVRLDKVYVLAPQGSPSDK